MSYGITEQDSTWVAPKNVNYEPPLVYIPKVIPFNFTDGGLSEADYQTLRNSNQQAYDTASSLAFSVPTGKYSNNRSADVDSMKYRAGFVSDSGAMFGNIPGVSTATGGGVASNFSNIFGETRQFGESGLIDGGNGDAENLIREQSLSHLRRDQSHRFRDKFIQFLTLDENIYTSPEGLLPYQLTEDTSVVYDTYEFRPSIAWPTPELAPTRYLGYTRKREQYAFARHGLGFRATTDFSKSPEGRRIMQEQLIQIMHSIQETTNYGVVYALVTCNDVMRQKVRKLRSYRSTFSELAILQDEKARWDIFKYKLGLNKLDAIATEVLREHGGTADTWVVVPESAIYMALESKTRNSPVEAGADGAKKARVDSVNAIKQWVNGDVMLIRSYAVDTKRVENPFQFRAQIGEYAVMTNSLHGNYSASAKYSPLCTAVEIYDQTRNAWARFTGADCLPHCGVFEPDGKPGKTTPVPNQAKRTFNTTWNAVPNTFYDEHTGVAWPYLSSLLYSSCHDNKTNYRMFANSMLKALERATTGQVKDFAAELAKLNGGEYADDLSKVLEKGALVGFPSKSKPGDLGVKASDKTDSILSLQKDALTYSATYGEGGAGPKNVVNGNDITEVSDVSKFATEEDLIPHLAQIMNDTKMLLPSEQFAIRLFALMPFNRNVLESLELVGLILPYTFVLWRAHMEYHTLAAAKMLRGLQTGATFARKGQWTIGEDPVIQEIAGSYTYSAKSIITNDKNVILFHNVFVKGYVGGAGSEFITTSSSTQSQYYPATGLYGDRHKNKDFANLYTQMNRPSVLATMVPYGYANSSHVANPLSLFGSLAVDYGQMMPSAVIPGTSEHGIPGLSWYERKYNFKTKIIPSPDPFSSIFVNQVIPTNAVCWRGHQRHFNPITETFGDEAYTEPNTGHWGPETYIGCNEFRDGNLSKTTDN